VESSFARDAGVAAGNTPNLILLACVPSVAHLWNYMRIRAGVRDLAEMRDLSSVVIAIAGSRCLNPDCQKSSI